MQLVDISSTASSQTTSDSPLGTSPQVVQGILFCPSFTVLTPNESSDFQDISKDWQFWWAWHVRQTQMSLPQSIPIHFSSKHVRWCYYCKYTLSVWCRTTNKNCIRSCISTRRPASTSLIPSVLPPVPVTKQTATPLEVNCSPFATMQA